MKWSDGPPRDGAPAAIRVNVAWLAVRSYLATVMKNDQNPLGALQRLMVAVFVDAAGY